MSEINDNRYLDPIDSELEKSIDKILESVKLKSNTAMDAGSVATQDQVDAIILELVKREKLEEITDNKTKVRLTIAHMCQIGATSPRFADSRIIDDYGCRFTVGSLREACKRNGTTVRKVARFLRNIIIRIAAKFGLEGNLAKAYKLENTEFDIQELIWVADFQTFSDNPAMPEKVRKWLLENYKTRFRPNLKETTNKKQMDLESR